MKGSVMTYQLQVFRFLAGAIGIVHAQRVGFLKRVLCRLRLFSNRDFCNQPYKCFTMTNELRQATVQYLKGSATVKVIYGDPIGTWCVGEVNDFSSLFCSIESHCPSFYNPLALTFNEDISMWNTSSATNMSNMFRSASYFNQDISAWNVSSVTNMADMFRNDEYDDLYVYNKSYFNQDISAWDVSSVINMAGMFFGAESFNQDISVWDVSSVLTDMSDMFWGAKSFNQDISVWNVSSVINMYSMFHGAVSFNQNLCWWGNKLFEDVEFDPNPFALSGCSTTGAPNFDNIPPGPFCHPCKPLKCFKTRDELREATVRYLDGDSTIRSKYGNPIGAWCVGAIRDFSLLFASEYEYCDSHSWCPWSNRWARSFNEDISTWNTSSATSMNYMFYRARSFNQDISAWDVSSVRGMISMFHGASSFNQDISAWNVSSVMSMSSMFKDALSFNQDLCSWGSKLYEGNMNISNSESISGLFGGTSCLITLDPNFNNTPPGPFCHPCL